MNIQLYRLSEEEKATVDQCEDYDGSIVATTPWIDDAGCIRRTILVNYLGRYSVRSQILGPFRLAAHTFCDFEFLAPSTDLGTL